MGIFLPFGSPFFVCWTDFVDFDCQIGELDKALFWENGNLIPDSEKADKNGCLCRTNWASLILACFSILLSCPLSILTDVQSGCFIFYFTFIRNPEVSLGNCLKQSVAHNVRRGLCQLALIY